HALRLRRIAARVVLAQLQIDRNAVNPAVAVRVVAGEAGSRLETYVGRIAYFRKWRNQAHAARREQRMTENHGAGCVAPFAEELLQIRLAISVLRQPERTAIGGFTISRTTQ